MRPKREVIGLHKERVGMMLGGEFNLGDLAANLAGVRFGTAVLRNNVKLTELKADFNRGQWLPEVSGVLTKETRSKKTSGLSAEQFAKAFPTPAALNKEIVRIKAEIEKGSKAAQAAAK